MIEDYFRQLGEDVALKIAGINPEHKDYHKEFVYKLEEEGFGSIGRKIASHLHQFLESNPKTAGGAPSNHLKLISENDWTPQNSEVVDFCLRELDNTKKAGVGSTAGEFFGSTLGDATSLLYTLPIILGGLGGGIYWGANREIDRDDVETAKSRVTTDQYLSMIDKLDQQLRRKYKYDDA